MSPVRVIHASYVDVPATAMVSPEPIKLTAMEAQWVVVPVLQHVLLYEGEDLPHFNDVLQSLSSSAATLRSFAPLAGKLVHLEGTGDVAIVCSSSDGVGFIVAESDADIHRLAGDEEHDVRVLQRLAPEVDMGELPTPVLAVQATRFEGGVAVGVTVHHGVADGWSLWTFVEAWATACRGETRAATPCFDRSLVKLPGGQELARSFLRKYAPNLPKVCSLAPLLEDHARLTRRTFTLDARNIQRLKERIVRLGEAHGAAPPSTFIAVVALAWTCFARCKPFASDDDVMVGFLADARHCLEPPVDAGYFGACLTGCIASLPARELRDEHALAAAARAVQEEVRKKTEDPMAGCNFLAPAFTVALERLMNVSGASSFRAYELADFGWGRPRRTENTRMNRDGQVALMRARDGLGVQVSVSLLEPAQMAEFKSQLLELVG
uniref:Anthocyanin 5-aromatic acyltransferase n=1 Tax=Triticum aestivum TaxID=4565 RepID=A0A3B6B7P3_WHEAT